MQEDPLALLLLHPLSDSARSPAYHRIRITKIGLKASIFEITLHKGDLRLSSKGYNSNRQLIFIKTAANADEIYILRDTVLHVYIR